jgi:hypothetical protein
MKINKNVRKSICFIWQNNRMFVANKWAVSGGSLNQSVFTLYQIITENLISDDPTVCRKFI